MYVRNVIMVKAEVGDDLSDFKKKMFLLKEKYNDTIYGLFNGILYVCFTNYTDDSQIERY